MKVIKATQQMLETRTLVLGFQGENLRTQLRIDCSPTFAEYPNATPALAVKPSSGETYPVFVERDGNEVVWDIVANNLVLKGDGELQLTFYKDNVIAKTSIGHITVNRSLQIDGEMPDAVATWIENANRKLAEVDAQITELEGMVDTATDAATRAEQSASTASTKAEQAAGSAATATEKATEATNAAGTATAKAAEAQTAAQTATAKATSAAESERIATAKAVEATTAAGTATTKAEQATEAAQTATEKAGDASASATAAHTSEINAAESADDALSAEVGANAAKTAAETSATQAGISEQNAGTAAQTATQKATEATQSATNAAIFAGTATTKAEEAAESAQAASDAQTAVEQTAEQLADSLEQIDQNTQDIAELDERKANVDGYYPDMTVGNAEQLNSSKFVENSEPYTLRTSGGSSDIGNREYLDAVVGGTIAWNQAVRDSASENSTDFADVVTVTDAVEDAAGVKVKIEPVQDLHGYDHPWPAGGGKNLLDINNIVVGNTTNWSVDVNGDTLTVTHKTAYTTGTPSFAFNQPSGTYVVSIGSINITGQVSLYVNGSWAKTINNGDTFTIDAANTNEIKFSAQENQATIITKIQIESGSTATSYEPYSNICPITGWTAAKVTRTGKNLFDKAQQTHLYCDGSLRAYINADMTSVYVPLLPNTTYTFSQSIVGGFTRYSLIDALETLTDMYSPMNPLDRSYITHTSLPFTFTNTNRKYLLCTIYRASVDTDKTFDEIADSCQLEYGSTATDYEPYAGQTYDITLPSEAGTVYGGELTVNADGSGSLVVDTVKAIADGTIAPTAVTDAHTAQFGSKFPLAVGYSLSETALKCNRLKPSNYSSAIDNLIFFPNATIVTMKVSAEVTDWVSWLSNNPVEFSYKIANPQTYTLTASEIRTLLGTNNVWADTGDVALTYTGTDEHLTLESGKKYLSRISGTDSMLLGSGQEITAAKGTDNVFDLTQMFGTAVADYVYGQGAAFFRKWFPNAVYPYNAGELKHVEGLESHDMVGFNAWDEEVRHGYYNEQTGAFVESSAYCANKNPIPAFPNTVYYGTEGSTYVDTFLCYDSRMNYLGTAIRNADNTRTTRPNTAFINFRTRQAYGGTYHHDICINLAHNNSRNGEYEPYEKHSYPLDSTVVLRGIPKVDANGVYWDGDRYLPDGTIERRYGVVDLGTLEWFKYTNASPVRYFAQISNGKVPSTSPSGTGIGMCSGYSICPRAVSPQDDKTIMVGSSFVSLDRFAVVVRDDDISSMSAGEFKAAMNGIYLVYEIMPTTETAQPYHSTQWVSDWGTEEFVSTGIVPVGHETRYPANLRDKLQHLPDAASGNGSYLISQTDGQMVLTPFPAPPSSAGNYVLKATVTGGVATYTWEVAT